MFSAILSLIQILSFISLSVFIIMKLVNPITWIMVCLGGIAAMINAVINPGRLMYYLGGIAGVFLFILGMWGLINILI